MTEFLVPQPISKIVGEIRRDTALDKDTRRSVREGRILHEKEIHTKTTQEPFFPRNIFSRNHESTIVMATIFHWCPRSSEVVEHTALILLPSRFTLLFFWGLQLIFQKNGHPTLWTTVKSPTGSQEWRCQQETIHYYHTIYPVRRSPKRNVCGIVQSLPNARPLESNRRVLSPPPVLLPS